MKLPLLTQSRLKCARACQREHFLRYVLGYRPVEDAHALRFGTLIHKALEAWWRAAMDGVGGQERLNAAMAMLLALEADPYDLARAQALLVGYHERWRDEPYEVLGVEVQFETELRNPATGASSRTWRLAGKLDVVVRDLRTGRVLIIEHKTSSEDISAGSEYWKRLRLDGQVSIYFEGAKSLGHDVAACLYDVLVKTQHRPLQANSKRKEPETPDEFRDRLMGVIAEEPGRFFARGEVVRLEAEMEEALFDVWQLGQQIRESELAQRFPRNPDSCVRWGRTCPFFSVCAGEASLEDGAQFVRSEVVHPELELPKEEASL